MSSVNMQNFELSEENLELYAAKNYYNPKYIDIEEFREDLNRFKYIKRLLNRYEEGGELSERLILNHLIVIFNSFGIDPSLKILELRMSRYHWPIIKPFLIFLKYIRNDQYTKIPMDPVVVDALRKI
jgi:hypothetical protein|tara:strand:+ start:303 stop:683 length:381 start_codon:yes stop_codon:yes gene_type:complete